MRLLERNKTSFLYIPYLGESDIDPETEMHTGEPVPTWGEAIPCKGNISIPSQRTSQTFYGTDIRYTHELKMEKPRFVFNEYGKIRWKGETYDIRAVRESLNVLSAALERQTANHAGGDADECEDDCDCGCHA